ncbi:hypothetical protein B566_EDAN007552 [Ephemera danica]|nr:hypothetical protein B566_EDAN007552 [Ephemera danica]
MDDFLETLPIDSLVQLNKIISSKDPDDIVIAIANHLRDKLRNRKLTERISSCMQKVLEDGFEAQKRLDEKLFSRDATASGGQNDANSTNVHSTSSTNTRADEFPVAGSSRTATETDTKKEQKCTSERVREESRKLAANPTQNRKTLRIDIEYFRNNKRHLVHEVQLVSRKNFSCHWHKELPNKIENGNPSNIKGFHRRCRDLFNKYPPQPYNDSFSNQDNNSQNLNSTCLALMSRLLNELINNQYQELRILNITQEEVSLEKPVMADFIKTLQIESLLQLNELIFSMDHDKILIIIADHLRAKLQDNREPMDGISSRIEKVLEDGIQAQKRLDKKLIKCERHVGTESFKMLIKNS